jgi:hypothetical protein
VFVACVLAAGWFAGEVLPAGEDAGAGAGRRAWTAGADAAFGRAGAGAVVLTVDSAGAAAIDGAGSAFSRGSTAAGAGADTTASVSWTAGEAAAGALPGEGAAADGTAELLRTAT